jgi:glyoxylase-like metal-dependent hydrolase (beta-lactamase superfamily II)
LSHAVPLDLNWINHPRSIASALLRSNDAVALIDPGPSSTLPALRKQLASHGLQVTDLSAILLTHIHLDHAGSTGALVRENPSIRVYVHSRGASHIVDPSRLLQSAGRLYGSEMQRLFGDFQAVPKANLQVLEGGETISLGTRQMHVVYTPGHAFHHVTYFDLQGEVAFVGDTAGICIEGNRYALFATPPPDISIEHWDASLDAILKLHPQRLFLTHFSYSDNPAEHIKNYREHLHRWSDRSGKILASGEDETTCMHKFAQEVSAEATQFLTPVELSHYLRSGALNLSWLGLARYHRKHAQAASTALQHDAPRT